MKQTKRKGALKMKTYEVNQVVDFMEEKYKVVEILSEGTLVHLKKVEAPFNTMVVPAYKIASFIGENDPNLENFFNEGTSFKSTEDIADIILEKDLKYRPDNRFTL